MSPALEDARTHVSHAENGTIAWLRLPPAFNVDELRRDVERVTADWWVAHFNQGGYHGVWTVAPLRGPVGEVHPIRMACADPTAADWADTELLAACPAVQRVLSQLHCPHRSTRFMRLASGARILEHTDHELGYEDGEVRLHIPIVTSVDVDFRLNGARIEMRPGELWYLNVNRPHSVSNAGVEDRVHLVIDCEVNEWVRMLFQDVVQVAMP